MQKVRSIASPSRGEQLRRVVLALALGTAALTWPLLEVGPKGGTLLRFPWFGGIDGRDLLSLPLLILLIVVLWRLPPKPRLFVMLTLLVYAGVLVVGRSQSK